MQRKPLSKTASIFDIKLFDGIVELYNDYIKVNFEKIDSNQPSYNLLDTDLATQLKEYGLDNVDYS